MNCVRTTLKVASASLTLFLLMASGADARDHGTYVVIDVPGEASPHLRRSIRLALSQDFGRIRPASFEASSVLPMARLQNLIRPTR
jgi:hypothetical protein